ncbi:MAG: sodium pump decarboxylase gamma subunit [Desulforhopalus sp.]|jgi:sodium pump decarboxylase gamma subunit
MTTTELLATFANPELMKALPMGDKLSAGLITTVLGMGITFSALIILLIIISWMNRLLNRTPAVVAVPTSQSAVLTPVKVTPPETNTLEKDNELVAAITTAIAMSLKTSTSNIVIRNIEKIEDRSPLWNRTGISEQMNSRF